MDLAVGCGPVRVEGKERHELSASLVSGCGWVLETSVQCLQDVDLGLYGP